MNKVSVTFKILSAKLRTNMMVYRSEILVNEEKIELDVYFMDKVYMAYKEIDTKITEKLSKKDNDILEDMLRKF